MATEDMRPSAEFYDLIHLGRNKDYKREAELLIDIIRSHAPSASTLLDVGTGTGEHVKYLQAYFQVEGLDLDPGMLKIAQAKNPNLKFHAGNMTKFQIGQQFDVITCLCSAIAYAETPYNLEQTIGTFYQHLNPDGVMLIEPWLSPDQFVPGYIGIDSYSGEKTKVTRMSISKRDGNVAIHDFDYLVGTSEGINHFTERLKLGMFSHEDFLKPFRRNGLNVEFNEVGLTGRGLYIATKSK